MDATTAQWSWRDLPSEPGSEEPEASEEDLAEEPGRGSEEFSDDATHRTEAEHSTKQEHTNETPPRQNRRHYGDRTCRICLDTVSPRFVDPSTGMLGAFMGEGSKPIYISPDDPDLGRLISPCKCKGSQRYVHEGCLNSWRHSARARDANPNFFTCPTCGYHYRLERIAWARRLQSRVTQIALTASIFLVAIFLLGFFADSIFSVWNDPMGTIADTVVGVMGDIEATAPSKPKIVLDEDVSWWEHFVKGFFSLGIIGFAKYLFTVTPWQWWNIRSSGIMGPAVRRGGGRARAENISWALVVIGALSFIYTVWKAVRALSNALLRRAGDGVLDVGGDDEDED